MISLQEPQKGKKKTSAKSKAKTPTEGVVKRQRAFNYGKFLALTTRLKPKYLNLAILVPVVAISIFGVMMVYSASHYNAGIHYDNPFYFFTRQLIGLILGLIVLGLVYFLDYRIYKKFAWIIFAGAIVLLLLVFVPGIGMARLGASRWIGIGGFSMQPSEIAKFTFVIFAAAIASKTPAPISGHPLYERGNLPSQNSSHFGKGGVTEGDGGFNENINQKILSRSQDYKNLF